nr:TetR/AcrR family transcriptional regulator [Spirochaetaceae bacterium]
LKSSRREFKKLGFDKASMRDIASTAKMTVGNLYRYYKNKEDLFGAIVGALYAELKELNDQLPNKPQERVDALIQKLTLLQKDYKVEWLILFNGSEGTRYNKVSKEVYTLLSDAFSKVFQSSKTQSTDMAMPLAIATIKGLNSILENERKVGPETAESFLNYMIKENKNFA